MRVAGVIAEYNPFHLGHAWHLAKTRRETGADAVVVAMSSVFTQRGEASLLPPAARVRMALENGADAVIALPALWSCREAEHFALGGAAILDGLGCSWLSFGSECADLALLQKAALLLEEEGDQLSALVRAGLDMGLSHPAALCRACESLLPGSGVLLSAPNSTLALCYLRALIRLGSSMAPVAIPRASDYHETQLGAGLPSASAVRGVILRGDWQGAERSMPPSAFDAAQRCALSGWLHRPDALDQALLYQLRTMAPGTLPGAGEGLEDRLLRAARECASRGELLEHAKTRRYPYARLSRLCAHALLGFTQSLFDAEPLPRAAWLLGMRRDAAPLMRFLSAQKLPLISKAADFDRTQPWFLAESRAYDLWTLGAGQPSGLAFTQGVVRV